MYNCKLIEAWIYVLIKVKLRYNRSKKLRINKNIKLRVNQRMNLRINKYKIKSWWSLNLLINKYKRWKWKVKGKVYKKNKIRRRIDDMKI